MKVKKLVKVLLILTIITISYTNLYNKVFTSISKVELLIDYGNEQKLYMLMNLGCSIERLYKLFGIALASCPSTSIELLKKHGFNVVPNFNVSIDVTIEDFRVLSVHELKSNNLSYTSIYWSWAVSRVLADVTWTYLGEDGYDAVIAILDTGIDPNHPLLAGKLIGWIEFDGRGRPVCSSPRDTHGHGTWVSSIAVGGDGFRYIFGVAPKAKLMVALVLPYGSGTAAQVLAGLEWALDPYDCKGQKLDVRRPNVVSMSFGAIGNYSNVFLPAISRLIENGIMPVAAIGNRGPYTSSNPGNIWGVIGVGATDLNNDIAMFSSYEEVEWPSPPENWPFKGRYPRYYRKPDMVAPGVDVPGAFPGGLLAIGSGTSAATPIVSGIAAIVSAKLKAQGLSGPLLVERVYDILTSTTTSIDHPGAGNGLANAYLAIANTKNMPIRIISVEVNPQLAKPLDRVTLSIEGIKPGTKIDIYVSGVMVYSGLLRSTTIPIEIPPTHMNKNIIVVVGDNGVLYGKTFIEIMPRVINEEVCFWGRWCKVFITGLGIGDLLVLYLGDNIISLDFANLRGTSTLSLITPIAEEGRYNLTIVDLSNPAIVLRTTIYINSTRHRETMVVTQTTIIYNNTYTLPISINVKPYYVTDSLDFIDVCIYNGSVVDVSIIGSFPLNINIEIVNITMVRGGIYRIWIKIGSGIDQETYAVIKAHIVMDNKRVPYIFTIRIVPKDPFTILSTELNMLKVAIYNNTSIVHVLIGDIKGIQNTINKVNKSVMELSQRINTLSNYIDALNITLNDIIQRYDPKLKEFNDSLAQVHMNIMLILTLVVVALGVSIYSIIKPKPRH